jgi:hypothetical protein
MLLGNLLPYEENLLKGTVQRDFLPLAFSGIGSPQAKYSTNSFHMAEYSGHVNVFATLRWLYIEESSGNLQVFLECIFRVTVFNVFKGTDSSTRIYHLGFVFSRIIFIWTPGFEAKKS